MTALRKEEQQTKSEIIEIDFVEIDMIRRALRDEVKLLRQQNNYRASRGMTQRRSYDYCYFYIGRYVTHVRFVDINLPAAAMQKLKNRMRSALPFSIIAHFVPFTRSMTFYLRGDKGATRARKK